MKGSLGKTNAVISLIPLAFIAEHNVVWYRISLWSSVLAVSLTSFFAHPSLLKKNKALTLCKHCPATPKTQCVINSVLVTNQNTAP